MFEGQTLKRTFRDVSETLDQNLRHEKIQRARKKGEAIHLKLQTRLAETSKISMALIGHPGNAIGIGLERGWLLALSILFITLDIPIQYLVNRAFLSNVSSFALLVTAPLLAILIAAIVHGLIVLLANDKEKPARSIRIAKVIAICVIPIVAISISLFVLARIAGPDLAARLESLSVLALFGCVEGLPFAGGAFGAWWHFLDQPRSIAKKKERLQALVLMTEHFLKQLDRFEDNDSPVNIPIGTQRQLSKVAVGLAILTIALSWASPAKAEGSMSDGRCALFIDITASVDKAHHSTAVNVLADGLDSFVHAFNCETVVVGHFESEGAFSPRHGFPVPRMQAVNCDEQKASTDGAQTLLQNFNGFREAARRKVQAACRVSKDSVTKALDNNWARFRSDVKTYMNATPRLDRETSSPIVGLVRHLLNDDYQVIAVLTDGIETVEKPLPHLAIHGATQLFLVGVPAAPVYGGTNATLCAMKNWSKAIPGINVLLYPQLQIPNPWNAYNRRDLVVVRQTSTSVGIP